MKVGHIIGGLEVVDVKRVNKLNLIQFTKSISEYIDLGYKIDVHSSRQIGLVLQCDVYKLESNVSESVGSTGVVSTEAQVNTETGTQNYVPEDTVVKVEHNGEVFMNTTVDKSDDEAVEVAKDTLDNLTTPEQNDVAVQKKPRAKKTT